MERVAQAVPQAGSRQERPPTAGRAVEAIGEAPPDLLGRLLRERRALALLVGLGKGPGTGGFGIAQVPNDTTTDNRGEVHFLGQTAAVLLIRQEIHRARQPTAGAHRDQTGVAERTDEPLERHRREVLEHGTQLHTEAAVGG
jgi:hypothetical protein